MTEIIKLRSETALDAAPPWRTHPKARQILDGACAAFHEFGYEGASVDDIARRAGVSKPTVYNHFEDKRGLFAAFMRREFEEHALKLFDVPDPEGDIEVVLQRIARQFVTFLLGDSAQRIFRIAVAEAQRFPELGRAFYESGPALGMRRLASVLAAADRRGALAVPDVDLAAHQFSELCKADLFYKRLLCLIEMPGADEIARVTDRAVATFVRAYRPDRPLHY